MIILADICDKNGIDDDVVHGDVDEQPRRTKPSITQVEKVKAAKIVQIKEMQQKQCPVCYSTALQHRLKPYLSLCSYLFLDIALILNASLFLFPGSIPRARSKSLPTSAVSPIATPTTWKLQGKLVLDEDYVGQYVDVCDDGDGVEVLCWLQLEMLGF